MSEDLAAQTHVARGATFMYIQGFLSAALGVVFVWFLLNTQIIAGETLFSKADLGLYTMLGFILSLTSTLSILALSSSSVRYISHYLAKGEKNEARSVVTRVLQVSATTSLAVIIGLLAFSRTLSDMFNSSPLVFQLIPICSALQIFYFQTQAFLQGLQKIRVIAILGIFYTLVQYSIGLSMVYGGWGIIGPVVGWLCALASSCLISLFISFRQLPPAKHAHKFRPLLSFSFPIYVAALLAFIVNWVDQILLFNFQGSEPLGAYSLAVRASVVSNLVSTSIVTSLFPKLSELRSTYGIASLRDAFRTSTRYAAFIGFPVALMMATLAYPIVVLFAPASFIDSVIPLAILCVASIPNTLGLAIIPIFYSLEKTKIASFVTVFSIIIQAALTTVSLAYLNLGLPSVAFSRLFAAIAGLALGIYLLKLSLRIEFDKEAIWKSGTASMIMVSSLLALELLRAIVDPFSYQFLILRLRLLPVYAFVGIFVYILSLIGLKAVKKRDIELLIAYLPNKLRWIVDILGRISQPRE